MKKNKIYILLFTLIFLSCGSDLFAEEVIIDESSLVSDLKIKDVPSRNKADIVQIQALDKITAKSIKYEVKVGESLTFERLNIDVLYCWKSSPEDVSENKALLKITENKLNKEKSVIFYGWMFSSSIGLSTLEHPMYDITIIDCKKSE